MALNITCSTLGVRDLKRSARFYKALGFKAGPPQEGVAFFQLNGSVLSLWSADALADDAGLPRGKGRPGGYSLAINVGSRKAVDALMAKARKAGAKLLKAPQDAFWGGYTGYFTDPDGHLWELAWNPFWKLDKKGNIKL